MTLQHVRCPDYSSFSVNVGRSRLICYRSLVFSPSLRRTARITTQANESTSDTAQDNTLPTPPVTDASSSWDLLNEYTRLEARGLASRLRDTPQNRKALAEALLIAANSDPTNKKEIILGVLSSDIRLAVRSLRDYCDALNLPFIQPESRVPGITALAHLHGMGVYIKYIAATNVCYAVKYDGRDRGVLVQIGQTQVGHLALGLFDEKMQKSEPTL